MSNVHDIYYGFIENYEEEFEVWTEDRLRELLDGIKLPIAAGNDDDIYVIDVKDLLRELNRIEVDNIE